VRTRPVWDLENLGIEKCTARDLKITLLHIASHGVLDLIALTLFSFLNARRPMQFSPWFHICTDFHVQEYSFVLSVSTTPAFLVENVIPRPSKS